MASEKSTMATGHTDDSSLSSPMETASPSTSFSLDKSRQYISALSILAVALFVGLPVWWKTTEVYRCPLPYKEINALADNKVPSEISFDLEIVDLSTSNVTATLHTFAQQIQKELVGSSAVASGNIRIKLNYRATVLDLQLYYKKLIISELQNCSTIEEYSKVMDSYLYTYLGRYNIVLMPKDLLPVGSPIGGEKNTIYVNRFRHALIGVDFSAEPDLSVYVPAVLKLFKHIYTERMEIEKALKIAFVSQQARVDMENMRQIRPARGYDIAITLLNPDPSEFNTSWNIVEATNSILSPFIEHGTVRRLGVFSISSQVFYYTDVKFKAKKDKDSYFVLSSQLPPMISSVESKLASHVSQLPSLNFLVYIPKKSEYPLHIRQSSKSAVSTDTFLVAQWGGVMIYNPPELAQQKAFESRRHSNQTNDRDGLDTPTTLLDSKGALKVAVDMEQVMPVFVQQLKMLFGIHSTERPTETDNVEFIYERGELGITYWDLDNLFIAKMIERIHMATTSLVSLVQLLDKVKNMVISDHLQEEVKYSLRYIKECYRSASIGYVSDAYLMSKVSMITSESAFFDPSILELLYFPDDQKFAIYIPLFLPISVPILLSSIAALKWLAAGFKSKDDGPAVPSNVDEKNSRTRKESESSSCPSTCNSEDLEQSEEEEDNSTSK